MARSVSLTLAPSTIVADGKTKATCTALLLDDGGEQVPDGELVLWAISGSGSVDPRVVRTQGGQVSTIITPARISGDPSDITVVVVPLQRGPTQLTRLDLVPPLRRSADPREWDVFVSHASEDKQDVAQPVAERLKERGLSVWLDTEELKVSDSLRAKIDQGLARCRYGVVILSHAFFGKRWPVEELNGLFAREAGGRKVILPVWHQLDQTEVARYSPILADRVATSTSKGLDTVADDLVRAISAADRESLHERVD